MKPSLRSKIEQQTPAVTREVFTELVGADVTGECPAGVIATGVAAIVGPLGDDGRAFASEMAQAEWERLCVEASGLPPATNSCTARTAIRGVERTTVSSVPTDSVRDALCSLRQCLSEPDGLTTTDEGDRDARLGSAGFAE